MDPVTTDRYIVPAICWTPSWPCPDSCTSNMTCNADNKEAYTTAYMVVVQQSIFSDECLRVGLSASGGPSSTSSLPFASCSSILTTIIMCVQDNNAPLRHTSPSLM